MTDRPAARAVTAMRDSARLVTVAGQLADAAEDDTRVGDAARRLAHRVRTQRFFLGVLGDFKRGKSTLVNALVGRMVLPAGVVPITNVMTEIHFGARCPGVTVHFTDGRRAQVEEGDLCDFVSEERNPGNVRAVARVELAVAEVIGAPGLVLVDTPGLGSVHEHQSAAARQALAESDGAIVVLSVDSPLSAAEHGLVADLASRSAPLFVVVNKADHLDAGDLDALGDYLTHQLEGLVAPHAEVYVVSARRALDHRLGRGRCDKGFDAFARDLAGFVRDDLAAARHATAVRELTRLATHFAVSLETERAAADLDIQRVHDQLVRFEEAGLRVRRQLDDDRVVLDHATSSLVQAVAADLTAGAHGAATEAWPRVLEDLGTLKGRELDRVVDASVGRAVEEAFEPLRRQAEETLEAGWSELASRFVRQAQAHADRLREVAAELFSFEVPAVEVPGVSSQQRRFSYFFVRVEGPGTSLMRALGSSLPLGWARRYQLAEARRRLESELDKHAGRAQFDFSQRLEEAAREFVAEMAAELDDIEASIVDAAGRARSLLAASDEERAQREQRRARANALVKEIAELFPSTP